MPNPTSPELQLLDGPREAWPINAVGGLYVQIKRPARTNLAAYVDSLAELVRPLGYDPHGRVTQGAPCAFGLGTVSQAIWFHDRLGSPR